MDHTPLFTVSDQSNSPAGDDAQKGMRFILSCTAEMKKCCKKHKKGKRCRKCPGRKL